MSSTQWVGLAITMSVIAVVMTFFLVSLGNMKTVKAIGITLVVIILFLALTLGAGLFIGLPYPWEPVDG